jgi:hypothetical protein
MAQKVAKIGIEDTLLGIGLNPGSHDGRCNRGIFDTIRAGNCYFICPSWLEILEQTIRSHVHGSTKRIIITVARSPFPSIPTNFVFVTFF